MDHQNVVFIIFQSGEDADYIPFSRISTNQISAGHPLTYSLQTLEDAISSECEEQVLLVYTPSPPYFIHVLEIVGHLVRENAIVVIEDDNSECITLTCQVYMGDIVDYKVDAQYSVYYLESTS